MHHLYPKDEASGRHTMQYFLLLFNIILMSVGQLFFKQSAIFCEARPDLNIVLRYLFNPWFYGALTFFGISTLTWVKILTEMKISVAYPILSISYILTAIGAYYFFGERLTALNLVGIFLVMIGVSIISIK